MAKKQFVASYRQEIGRWGEIVIAACLRRAKYFVKTQPLDNRIAFVDMSAERDGVRFDVQAKATAMRGEYYKLDFSYVREILDHIERQRRDVGEYRYALAIANCRKGHVFFFVGKQIEEAYSRKDDRTASDQMPGTISFGYRASARNFPLLVKEINEGIEISRSFKMNGDGGYTQSLFGDDE